MKARRETAWSSGHLAEAAHIRRFVEMREAFERRVDRRERLRVYRELQERTLQLGLMLSSAAANDEQPQA